MREEHVLPEGRSIATRPRVEGHARECGAEGEVVALAAERHEARPRLDHRYAELPGDAQREVRGAELRDRQAAGRDHQRVAAERVLAGPQREAAGPRDGLHLAAGPHRDAGRGALGQQHADDLPRTAVAEELTELLLVPGDAVLLDLGDEVGGPGAP